MGVKSASVAPLKLAGIIETEYGPTEFTLTLVTHGGNQLVEITENGSLRDVTFSDWLDEVRDNSPEGNKLVYFKSRAAYDSGTSHSLDAFVDKIQKRAPDAF